MRTRFISMVSGLLLLLGLGVIAPPLAQANDFETYCVASPGDPDLIHNTYYWDRYEPDDAYLMGKIVRPVPLDSRGYELPCSHYNGTPLDYENGEHEYGWVEPEAPVVNTPAAPLPATPPTYQASWPTEQFICIGNPNTLQHFPYFNESDYEAWTYMNGQIIRPMPNVVGGCSRYDGTPLREWEFLFVADPPPQYLAPTAEQSIPEDYGVTRDYPSSEYGGNDLEPILLPRDPAPNTNNSMPGCNGKFRLMASNWRMDLEYSHPEWYGWNKSPVLLTATASYWYCPNLTGPDLVSMTSVRYCSTHYSTPPPVFNGVRWNPYFADLNTTTNPPTFTVGRGSGLQSCGTQNVRGDTRRWLQVNQQAQWSVVGWIKRDGQLIDLPTKEVVFKYNGVPRKSLSPSTDVPLGDWINA